MFYSVVRRKDKKGPRLRSSGVGVAAPPLVGHHMMQLLALLAALSLARAAPNFEAWAAAHQKHYVLPSVAMNFMTVKFTTFCVLR